MSTDVNVEKEKEIITQVIENSIGWAQTKDTALSYSCYAHDSDLFFYNPDDSYIHGFDSFKKLTENFFMKDEFKAISCEIKDLKLNLSQSGTVAWYSCILDDRNEWNGQPANWIDVRWTGVLEKRDDKWVIVQMHFSFPTGRE